ncbi:MAG TPA: RidA family protein [Dehalococcoidia bacterium]|jgi:enamine deaminase RidA (YjgF/YER057c/UK114 family)
MSKQALEPAGFPFYDYRHYAFSLGVEAGGRVWLSGHTGSRFDSAQGRMVSDGSLAEQATVAHEKQRAILAAAGMDFHHAVHLVDYVTPAGRDAYAELSAVRRRLFGTDPPSVSTMVVNGLLRPEALIECELTAVRGPVRRFGSGNGFAGVPAAAAVQSGDLLYCSALLPLDGAGRVVAGGLLAQVEQIYRNAEALLGEAGYAMADVVRTHEYIHASALPQYRDTWRVRAAHLGAPGGCAVAATGIVMSELAVPGALLQVEFVACRGEKRALNPGWRRYERLTYAPAVRAGDLIFCSGQLATDPETGQAMHPGDVAAQARVIYGNVRRVLALEGLSMDAIVRTVEYVTPAALSDYGSTAAVRREFFREPLPAASGLLCQALLRPEALIEIECLAVAG